MDNFELLEQFKKHKPEIDLKLREFSKNQNHANELFFCLLTPQSKAEKCWQAVEELEKCRQEKIKIENCLRTKTRFYRNKARYFLEANKKWHEIKLKLEKEKNPRELRNWLAENVKGLGMKEASHFLRNIGKSDNQLAILDRHVLRKLEKLGVIGKEIKLNRKSYLEIEQKMQKFAQDTGISFDSLDLLFWKIESGRIFK